jgi:DNA polymerase-1
MLTKPKQVLVDGDPFAYRAAFSCENDPVEDALDKLDEILEQSLNEVMWELDPEQYQVFLTGKGNFRYKYSITHEYKGNRKNTEKPQHLQDIRNHMIKNWDAVVSKGEEADDLCGIWATNYGKESIVISIDKDMLQIPCSHYNPNKRTMTEMGEFEGLRFFYTQILTGDKADNIIGLYGIGPKKADKILADCTTEAGMYEECLRSYGGDEARVIENARLLWLRRYENQIWEPPKCVSDQA